MLIIPGEDVGVHIIHITNFVTVGCVTDLLGELRAFGCTGSDAWCTSVYVMMQIVRYN